jgi:hypothetical protein
MTAKHDPLSVLKRFVALDAALASEEGLSVKEFTAKHKVDRHTVRGYLDAIETVLGRSITLDRSRNAALKGDRWKYRWLGARGLSVRTLFTRNLRRAARTAHSRRQQ